MDKSFTGLMTLRSLAMTPGFDEHDRLRGGEMAIKRHVKPYEGTERQSELERIGEASNDEANQPSKVCFLANGGGDNLPAILALNT